MQEEGQSCKISLTGKEENNVYINKDKENVL